MFVNITIITKITWDIFLGVEILGQRIELFQRQSPQEDRLGDRISLDLKDLYKRLRDDNI